MRASKASYPVLPQIHQISDIWKVFVVLIAGGRNYLWSVIKELRREDVLPPDGSSALQTVLWGLKEPGRQN